MRGAWRCGACAGAGGPGGEGGGGRPRAGPARGSAAPGRLGALGEARAAAFVAGAGKVGDLGRTELWPLRAVHISAGGGGELYIAVPACGLSR